MHNTILISLLGLAVFVFYKVVTAIAISRQNAGTSLIKHVRKLVLRA